MIKIHVWNYQNISKNIFKISVILEIISYIIIITDFHSDCTSLYPNRMNKKVSLQHLFS